MDSLSHDSVRIDAFRFYVSNIVLLQDDSVVFRENTSYHLVDLADTNSLHLRFAVNEQLVYNTIQFQLGIDSLTNESGALGGALDPTRGMYWAWQSGYINLKLEGYRNSCPTRNHLFEFHLGGYRYPFNAIQPVSRKLPMQTNTYTCAIDIGTFLDQISLAKNNHIMSPSHAAVNLSQQLADLFYFLP